MWRQRQTRDLGRAFQPARARRGAGETLRPLFFPFWRDPPGEQLLRNNRCLFHGHSDEFQGVPYLKRCQVSKALPHLPGSISLFRLKCNSTGRLRYYHSRRPLFPSYTWRRSSVDILVSFPHGRGNSETEKHLAMAGGLGKLRLPLRTHPAVSVLFWSWEADVHHLHQRNRLTSDFWSDSANGRCRLFEERGLFSFLCPFLCRSKCVGFLLLRATDSVFGSLLGLTSNQPPAPLES